MKYLKNIIAWFVNNFFEILKALVVLLIILVLVKKYSTLGNISQQKTSSQKYTANYSPYWNDIKATYWVYKTNGMSGLISLSQEQYKQFKNNYTIDGFRKCLVTEIMAIEINRQFFERTKIPPLDDDYFNENGFNVRFMEAAAKLGLSKEEQKILILNLKELVFNDMKKIILEQRGGDKK